MRSILRHVLLSAMITASSSATAAGDIDYPDDYRQWSHVKSMTIHEGHPLQDPFLGIHHIYANPKGLAGLDVGKFEDGSVLVFDQLKYETKDQASTEGERVLLGVMVKDSQRFPKTDGWGYEAWAGGVLTERLVTDGGQSCHGCHTPRRDRDFVYSEWRE